MVGSVLGTATATKQKRSGPSRGSDRSSWFEPLFVPVLIAALVLYLGVSADGFFTRDNLINILLQGSILAVVSFGMTFVILTGELDLSVGSGVALCSVVSALAVRDAGSVWLGVLAALGCGLAIGLFNGLVVTQREVPSFIAPLAPLVIVHGIALALTNGAVIGPIPPDLNHLADDSFLGLRWLIWLMAAVFVLLYLIQSRTTFGVRVKAVGGNRAAARLSTISVPQIVILCFVISGVCAGIGGLAVTARVESGQPNTGGLLALYAVAAVVVGGTSPTGGRGSLARALWGVLLLSILDNGLDVKGVDPDVKQAIIGVVFIGAASIDFIRTRLHRRQSVSRDGEPAPEPVPVKGQARAPAG